MDSKGRAKRASLRKQKSDTQTAASTTNSLSESKGKRRLSPSKRAAQDATSATAHSKRRGRDRPPTNPHSAPASSKRTRRHSPTKEGKAKAKEPEIPLGKRSRSNSKKSALAKPKALLSKYRTRGRPSVHFGDPLNKMSDTPPASSTTTTTTSGASTRSTRRSPRTRGDSSGSDKMDTGSDGRPDTKGASEDRSSRSNASSRKSSSSEGESGSSERGGPPQDQNPFSRNPGEALASLLHRLAPSGLEDFLPTPGKYGHILSALKDEEGLGEMHQIGALNELCESLSMAIEDTLGGFNPNAYAPVLTELLLREHNPDIMLLSARALSNMMDVLPQSANAVVNAGAIPILCSKLLAIEYIDLAEQALQTLHKISQENAGAILREGGLMAVLTYLDFFPMGVQRMCVSIAAQMCRHLSPDDLGMVQGQIQQLGNLLTYSDQKIVEQASVCVYRIADTFSGVKTQSSLEELMSESLLTNLSKLISKDAPVDVAAPIYTFLVRTLYIACRASPKVVKTLLSNGIVEVLHGVLHPSSASEHTAPGSGASTSNAPRASNHLFELLSLTNILLPPLAIVDSQEQTRRTAPKLRARIPTGKKASDSAEAKAAHEADEKERLAIIVDNPDYLSKFARLLFPSLTQLFTATVNQSVRHKCLAAITKIIKFSAEDVLTDVLKDQPVSRFVSKLLSSGDDKIVRAAIHLAEAMLSKLPDIFRKHFVKEGVVFELSRLGNDGKPPVGAAAALPSAAGLGISPLAAAEQSAPPNTPFTPDATTPSVSGTGGAAGSGQRTATPSSAGPAGEDAAATGPDTNSVAYLALELVKTFFKDFGTTDSDEDDGSTLSQLRQLVKDLNAWKSTETTITGASSDSATPSSLDSQRTTLTSIRDIIVSTEEAVSAFEFLQSDVVEGLVTYLIELDLTPSVTVKQATRARADRVALFTEIFFSDATGSGSSSPINVVIERTQAALELVDEFDVVVNEVTSQSGSTSSAALKALRQPFKLRLERDTDVDSPVRGFSTSVVLIEPLASISAVEEFVWNRVEQHRDLSELANRSRQRNAAKKQGGASSRSSAASSKSAAGSSKATNKDDSGDAEGSDEERESKEDKEEEEEEEGREGMFDDESSEDEDDMHEDEYEEDDMYGDEMLDEYDDFDEMEGEFDDDDDGLRASFFGRSSTQRDSLDARDIDSPRGSRMSVEPASGGASSGAAGSSTPGSSVNARIQSEAEKHHLVFTLNGRVIPYRQSIFQAVSAYRPAGLQNQPVSRLWERVHTLKFRTLTPSDYAQVIEDPGRVSGNAAPGTPGSVSSPTSNASPTVTAGGPTLAHLRPPKDLYPQDCPGAVTNILSFLHILHELSANLGLAVTDSELLAKTHPATEAVFMNEQLTAKLGRQLQDPLAVCSGALPPWIKSLTTVAPYLFPFELRRLYVQATGLGLARAVKYLQPRWAANDDQASLQRGRIQRDKVRISRDRMLESAFRVMAAMTPRSVLEVEYFGEAGTGLGPTLEFYSEVSRLMQAADLHLWRSDDPASPSDPPLKTATPTSPSSTKTAGAGEPTDTEYVYSKTGLFPLPSKTPGSKAQGQKHSAESYFEFLGTFVAKAFYDGRLLDLPLSPLFYARVVHHRVLGLQHLAQLDPSLASSILRLKQVADQRDAIMADSSMSTQDKNAAVSALTLDGAPIESLALDFTLPGDASYELCPDGAAVNVTIDNLSTYIDAVIDAVFRSGVEPQFNAFISGFEKVLPISVLSPFCAGEIDQLLCGEGQDNAAWDKATLTAAVVCDHGYAITSRAIQNLFDVMSSFSPQERTQFVKFLTGCPRLPIGGFKNLNPRLTVVRKTVDTDTDEQLPSVMTCANYLKLPDYSTVEIMRARLVTAMTEGQQSFHLS